MIRSVSGDFHDNKRLSVAVLSGFRGAGKTTLSNDLLDKGPSAACAGVGVMGTATADRAAIVKAAEPDCLDAITTDGVAMVIWQRPAPCRLDRASYADRTNVRLSSSVGALCGALRDAMGKAGYPSSTARLSLETDILALARRFGQALGIDQVEIRLEVVTTDACKKFHADYVIARLLTTYAGPGTQWLHAEDAKRIEAGEEPHRVEQLATGDVAILKGRLSPDECPAFHRSPPISGTGEVRLVLAISPAPTPSLN